MKALVKLKAAAGLELIEVAKPSLKPYEVLIQVKKAAICGTDVHIYHWDKWASQTIKPPLIIGHEFFGIIAQLGPEVVGFTLGQRVSGEGHLSCGSCRNCRTDKRHLCIQTQGLGIHYPGAFAEYVVLPALNVIALPDSIPDDIAAILDPLGNAVHSACHFDISGQSLLITGAGPIGLMALLVAKQIGAYPIFMVDVNPERLLLAKKLGATETILSQHDNCKALMQAHHLEGFDHALEMSGQPQALQTLIEHVYPGAEIALLGILPKETMVNGLDLIFKSLTLKGIYGRVLFKTWYKMLTLLAEGLDPRAIITHHFKFSDYQQAFELAASGKAGKIILEW